MSKDDYLSEEQVCEILMIEKTTMQTRRSRGENHPPYKKIGKTILYPKKDFEKWMNEVPTRKSIKTA